MVNLALILHHPLTSLFLIEKPEHAKPGFHRVFRKEEEVKKRFLSKKQLQYIQLSYCRGKEYASF